MAIREKFSIEKYPRRVSRGTSIVDVKFNILKKRADRRDHAFFTSMNISLNVKGKTSVIREIEFFPQRDKKPRINVDRIA